jgi:hypothetical protein
MGLTPYCSRKELQRSGTGLPATALRFMVILLVCADAGSFNTFTTPPRLRWTDDELTCELPSGTASRAAMNPPLETVHEESVLAHPTHVAAEKLGGFSLLGPKSGGRVARRSLSKGLWISTPKRT